MIDLFNKVMMGVRFHHPMLCKAINSICNILTLCLDKLGSAECNWPRNDFSTQLETNSKLVCILSTRIIAFWQKITKTLVNFDEFS